MKPETRAVGTTAGIYLDHAAATPLAPGVAAAMAEAREAGFANPSSPHAAGRLAKRILETARDRILAIVGADLGPGASLVFTSGATEANRLGIVGLAAGRRGRVLFSARDHSSAAAAAGELFARGWEPLTLPLGPDGSLRLSAADDVGEGTDILCATLACGQSGTIENVASVADWAAARPGRFVHLDATQAILVATGHGPGTFGLPSGAVATLVLAPHKFGGPRGIGGLGVRGGISLAPAAAASQEGGLRGGTEAVDLAVGFAAALEAAVADRQAVARRVAALRERLESRLVAAAAAAGIEARVVAAAASRSPHVATVAFAGLDRQAFVMAADIEGVACASGTACASGSSEPSPALVAMGLPEALVAGAVRFSLGRSTTDSDVDSATARLARVFERMSPRKTA